MKLLIFALNSSWQHCYGCQSNLKAIILAPQRGKLSGHGKYNHNSAISIAWQSIAVQLVNKEDHIESTIKNIYEGAEQSNGGKIAPKILVK